MIRGCINYDLFASGPTPAGRKRCGTCVGQKKSCGEELCWILNMEGVAEGHTY